MKRKARTRNSIPSFAFVVDGETEIWYLQMLKHNSGYEKTEKFFKKRDNDIYLRLKPYLHNAIKNAAALDPFDRENPERAICEMHKLFMCEELKPCLKNELS